MIEKIADDPFDELPEELVEEMLNQCDELGEILPTCLRR